MHSFTPSGSGSAAASISDLDGYTIRDNYTYVAGDQDEFGFDPPQERAYYPKIDQVYSPPAENTDSPLGGWPGFEREEDRRQKPRFDQTNPVDTRPNTTTSISRFGQITPPRTDATGSEGSQKPEDSLSPRTAANTTRRKSKQVKDPSQPATTATGRKRKNSRKAVAANADSPSGPDDNKRKASLEKNRLAAAKCRVNKKEKTEILQRDSHDKAVHNAYLKDQVMRMKEEVQQLNAILLAHASCEGCESPEEIQKHLQELSAEYLPNQMSIGGFPNYSEMNLGNMPSGSQAMSDDGYFAMAPPNSSMLNPPLPEFNRSADFEVHTPMQTD
jgi:hypothetical protein